MKVTPSVRVAVAFVVLGFAWGGPVTGPPLIANSSAATLPDSRGWEMVSPVDKNGGDVDAPESGLGEGLAQAGASGNTVAFSSRVSFGQGAGASPISQYVATREPNGWSTANVTPALLSGTYEGDPYLLLSADLDRALVSGGWSCRDGGESCAAENPPLGPGGPAGYRNAYIREGGAYTPLITTTNFPALPPQPKEFDLAIEGSSPDLRYVVFATTSGLYLWSQGTIVLLTAAPGAALAAPAGAVSESGARIYFSEGGGLYLWEGGTTKLVSAGGQFGAASADGGIAFYLEGGHVRRYDAGVESSTDLTPAGGATAVLGASPEGSALYYVAADGLYRWQLVAGAKRLLTATPAQLPPLAGTAGVAAAGARFFFDTTVGVVTGDTNHDTDVYEWEAGGLGSCTQAVGCIALVSSGRAEGGAFFAGASVAGDDVFFRTDGSLVPSDPGSIDLYDARVGGGFPLPPAPISCVGDACQPLPAAPEDPTPGTLPIREGNPPLRYEKAGKRRRHKHHRHHPAAKRGNR